MDPNNQSEIEQKNGVQEHLAQDADLGTPRSRMITWVVVVVLYLLVALSQNLEVLSQPAVSQVGQTSAIPNIAKIVMLLDNALEAKGQLIEQILARLDQAKQAKQAKQAEQAKQTKQAKQAPADNLAWALVQGETFGSDKALEKLDSIEKKPDWSMVKDETNTLVEDTIVQADADAIRTLYTDGVDTLSPDQQDQLRTRYGWLGRLTLTHDLDKNDPARKAFYSDVVWVVAFVLVAGTVLGVGFVGGLTMGIIAAVAFFQKRITSRFVPPTPGGSVYLETFALFLGLFFVLHITGGVLGDVAQKNNWSAQAKNSLTLGILVAQWAILPVIFWPVMRRVRLKNWKQAVGWYAPRGVLREVAAGVLGYLAGIPLLVLAMLLTFILITLQGALTGSPPPSNNAVLDLIQKSNVWVILAMVSLATIWAPIVEETLFRGGLYRHFRGRLGVFGAGLLTAFLFAFLHSYGPLLLSPLIALGFTFAMIRQWRGSLIASITAHCIHNATSMTLMLLAIRAMA